MTLFFLIGIAFFSAYLKNSDGTETPLSTEITPITQTFILLGDAGTGVPAQISVATRIKEHCEVKGTCQAAFIIGDVIYDEGVKTVNDEKFQSRFELPYAELNFPFYIAFGNHDYLGCTHCYLDYSALSEKWKMPSRYYTQTFNSVKFIVIDTEKFDVEQQTWLKNQLTEDSSVRTVILGHRPLQTDELEKHLENWNGKKELTDIVCHQADYYISGHAHILEDPGQLGDCSVKLLISGTAGSFPRQVISNTDSPFHASVNGFLSFSATQKSVEYSFIDLDGNIVHSGTKQ